MANLDVQSQVRVPLTDQTGESRSVTAVASSWMALPHGAGAVAGGKRRPFKPYGRIGKRFLDVVLVVAFAPLYLPMILLAALLLFIEGGNPFYRQDRLGRNGARFSILKLRTMVRDADEQLDRLLAEDPAMKAEWDATQKLKADPRITRIGAILRRTSMDELPQLWNVLTGEMSLVGPRPMMPEQLSLYGDPRHYFAQRPGITGLWQVDRRNESTFADRKRYDATYDTHLSFWTDAKTLWKTIGVVLRRTGH